MNWTDGKCELCPLSCKRTQIVISTPPPKGGILAVGEAPGADEDERGEGFVGTAGKTLDRLFLNAGLTRQMYGRANICRCRPPENRKPTKQEQQACLPYLASLIEDYRPSVIVAVGVTPMTLFCGKGGMYETITAHHELGEWTKTSFSPDASLASAISDTTIIIPMPHTSPLAFNRNAPDGRKWADIAQEQIRLAVSKLA